MRTYGNQHRRARLLTLVAAALFVFSWAACQERTATASVGASEQPAAAAAESGGTQTMKFEITSTAFQNGARIPQQYTGDGADVSPPLQWTGPPVGAKSFALICDDPGAPAGTWVHWVLWNVPGDKTQLPENVQKVKELPDGARQGTNDFAKIGYNGPAPPRGTEHRYYFKLYALDVQLSLPPGAGKGDLLKAMQGHVLGEAQLMGRYKR